MAGRPLVYAAGRRWVSPVVTQLVTHRPVHTARNAGTVGLPLDLAKPDRAAARRWPSTIPRAV